MAETAGTGLARSIRGGVGRGSTGEGSFWPETRPWATLHPGTERERERERDEIQREGEQEKDGRRRHGDLWCSGVALAGAAEEARTARSSGPWTASA